VFLNGFLPYLVVRFDEARLSPERLARAWNPASFWVAIVVFGPFSIPVHFVRTRRSLLGLALGLSCGAAALLLAFGVVATLGWLLGVDA
ncbi:MAG TPA: hypothetical protein VGM29_16595, partial [Polyangiaceae bacterium]